MTKNWKLIVALGVVAVILVYFIALFATSFGEQTAKNNISDANFDLIKEEASENVDVGDVYMTLNWNEFSDVVVVQVGNNANIDGETLRKDHRFWYYIFNKTTSGSLILNGVFTHKFKMTAMWTASDVYELFLMENKDTDNYNALSMLTHEFENIYTGKIVDINGNSVNAYRKAHIFGGDNGKVGSQYYLTKNSDLYTPASGGYKVYLKNADKYSLQIINEIYKYDITSDTLFGVDEGYFACFSQEFADIGGEPLKGWVQFNMKISVDYKDYTLQKFDYDHLSTMYKAVKDYTYCDNTNS